MVLKMANNGKPLINSVNGKQAVMDVLNRLNKEGVDGEYSFDDYKIIHLLAKIQSKHK